MIDPVIRANLRAAVDQTIRTCHRMNLDYWLTNDAAMVQDRHELLDEAVRWCRRWPILRPETLITHNGKHVVLVVTVEFGGGVTVYETWIDPLIVLLAATRDRLTSLFTEALVYYSVPVHMTVPARDS
jgi:hypothetical protein